MRITNLTAILHNDETARHISNCYQCRDNNTIQTHIYNFFIFLMGNVDTDVESIKERELKVKEIQKKITSEILAIHWDRFETNAWGDPINKSGYDNFDIGKLNEAMALKSDIKAVNPSRNSEYFTDNSEN